MLSVLIQKNFRLKNVVGICEVVLRVFEKAIFRKKNLRRFFVILCLILLIHRVVFGKVIFFQRFHCYWGEENRASRAICEKMSPVCYMNHFYGCSAFLHAYDTLQNIAIHAAQWLAVLPLPHTSTTKCLLQLSLKVIRRHRQNAGHWDIFKCFKSIRAIVSTLFIVEYFKERVGSPRKWSSASPGSELNPPC